MVQEHPQLEESRPADPVGAGKEQFLPEEDIALQEEQLKRIEDEQKANPLVSGMLPFVALAAEYDIENSPTFHVKATELGEIYSSIRYIRGDGNCFYRAVLVGLVEILLDDRDRLVKFIATSKEWVKKLTDLGFPEWTCTDFCEYFIEFLENIAADKTDKMMVFENLNNDSSANYILMFLRLITSGYLKQHAEEYAPFIDEGMSVSQYCEQEIEAMWKDADHLAITCLAKALETHFRVEYMDRTAAPNGGWHYDFPSELEDASPEITLLYRPGHYDLIYKKK